MEKKLSLKFYAIIYFKIISQDFKSKLSYRADFIISTIGMIFTNIAGIASFWLLFNKFPTLNGWNYYEILFLYGFCLIALSPLQCLFDNNWALSRSVFTGDFIKYCFRPINIFFYYISEVFDIKGLGQLAIGILTLSYAWSHLGIEFTVGKFIILIFQLITASLFMIGIMNLAAATAFWIVYSTYVLIITFKLADYAKYPVSIFNKGFKLLFTFVIPIAFVAYYPSLVFLRPNNIPMLTYFGPIFGCAFFYLSYLVWITGAKKYSGTGN